MRFCLFPNFVRPLVVLREKSFGFDLKALTFTESGHEYITIAFSSESLQQQSLPTEEEIRKIVNILERK